MDGQRAMGSSSMKLDNKRAPYEAGPLRQASRLCIRVTPVRCLADIPEPRFGTTIRTADNSMLTFRMTIQGSSGFGLHYAVDRGSSPIMYAFSRTRTAIGHSSMKGVTVKVTGPPPTLEAAPRLVAP